MRLSAMLGEQTGHAVDVFELRQKLAMTQRVFGAQFGVSRQQVQKWESGKLCRSGASSIISEARGRVGNGSCRASHDFSHPECSLSARRRRISGSPKKRSARPSKTDGSLTRDTSPGPWPGRAGT